MREGSSPSPEIDPRRFRRLGIDGGPQTKDVFLLPGRVIGRRRREAGHALHLTCYLC
jgi:hypothetical protein